MTHARIDPDQFGQSRLEIVLALTCDAMNKGCSCSSRCQPQLGICELKSTRPDVELESLLLARLWARAQAAGLSTRERTLLELLWVGRSSEEIAVELGISPRTVKFHKANVFAKLGAASQWDLLRLLL